MSRIGRAPIQIPQGVQVTINDHLVTVAGPLGTLSQVIDKSIDVKVEDGHVLCTRHSDDKDHRALHGLYRALIHNMVVGVTKGFEKSLIVNGVGYKVTLNGNNKMTLNISTLSLRTESPLRNRNRLKSSSRASIVNSLVRLLQLSELTSRLNRITDTAFTTRMRPSSTKSAREPRSNEVKYDFQKR